MCLWQESKKAARKAAERARRAQEEFGAIYFGPHWCSPEHAAAGKGDDP